MTHPDEGTLLALMDGELDEAARAHAAEHVAACGACEVRMAQLEGERLLIHDVLSELDVEPPMAGARAAVLARTRVAVRSAAAPARTGAWWRSNVAKAAGLILAFAAAGTAAMPGSPVRAWLESATSDPEVEPTARQPDAATPSTAAEETPSEVGVRLSSDDELVVSVLGIGPGAEVHVRLVDADGSGVYAEEGARFQTGPGRVEAHVDGGWVRIELSRLLEAARVEVNGATYLTTTGGRVQLLGPVADSAAGEIRFRVAGPGR